MTHRGDTPSLIELEWGDKRTLVIDQAKKLLLIRNDQPLEHFVSAMERLHAMREALPQPPKYDGGQLRIYLHYEDEDYCMNESSEYFVDRLEDARIWSEAVFDENGNPQFRWKVSIRGEVVYDKMGVRPSMTPHFC